MSLHYDESRPSLLQRQTALAHYERRTRLHSHAAKISLIPPPIKPAPHIDIYSTPRGFWNIAPIEFEIPRLLFVEELTCEEGETIYTIREIQKAVCIAAKISRAEIISIRRTEILVIPRQTAMALCNLLTTQSMVTIAKSFGGRDHTTGMWAVEKMTAMIASIRWMIDKKNIQEIAEEALKEAWKLYPLHRPMKDRHCSLKKNLTSDSVREIRAAAKAEWPLMMARHDIGIDAVRRISLRLTYKKVI